MGCPSGGGIGLGCAATRPPRLLPPPPDPPTPTPHPPPLPQGTKACLGWDRGSQQAGAITTGTTAVVDLWLQLLLAALQVGCGVIVWE